MTVFLVFLLIAVIALYIWGRWIEPFGYQINRHKVSINKPLPAPLKILHLSDIHFTRKSRSVFKFFDRLSAEDYDLVVVSGDIVDSPDGFRPAQKNLKKVKSRYGVFAVLGNHDYYYYACWDSFIHNFPDQNYPLRPQKTDLLVRFLRKSGIGLLRNETIEFHHEGVPVLIHGLDDPTTGKANVRAAMQNFDRRKINVLLTHTIDAFLDIGENEIDLSFSGHSHGGQIRLPWIGPIITHTTMGKAYASGVLRHKGAVCSISRGIGSSQFVPVRLLCPPEAIVLTVHGKGE